MIRVGKQCSGAVGTEPRKRGISIWRGVQKEARAEPPARIIIDEESLPTS